MKRSRAQLGDGKLGCLLWLILVGVGGLIAFKAIPVKIASSELYDFMVEQAKFSTRATTGTIENRIVRRAQELRLPVDKKAVTVTRAGDRIRMEARFTVPLEFPGYTYYWDFDLQVDRPVFMI